MFKKRPAESDSVPRRRRALDDDTSTPVSPQTGSQFRRGQTLSSYRVNTPEESSRQKVHTLAQQRRKVGGIFLVVGIVTVLLGLLLWQLIAQVQVATSSKQLSRPFEGADYAKVINEYLALNPAERLRFALNEDHLTQYVSEQLPEVATLTLSGSSGIAQSDFSVTFRTPVAGWQINGNQYYVDQTGVVFQKNYYDSPAVQIVDESGIRPEEGSTVVGNRLLGFLGKIVAGAGERGYTVTKALLPQAATRQVDIELQGTSTRIKLSIDRGAGEQTEDMDRALKYLQTKSVTAQYIDVRIAGRTAFK